MQEMPRFPSIHGIPFTQLPARRSWTATKGATLVQDVMCGRDLTNMQTVILYVFCQVAPNGLPTTIPCRIVDAQAGHVRVEFDTSMAPVGEWRWTLFLMGPTQPIPAYTGTLKIEDE